MIPTKEKLLFREGCLRIGTRSTNNVCEHEIMLNWLRVLVWFFGKKKKEAKMEEFK